MRVRYHFSELEACMKPIKEETESIMTALLPKMLEAAFSGDEEVDMASLLDQSQKDTFCRYVMQLCNIAQSRRMHISLKRRLTFLLL